MTATLALDLAHPREAVEELWRLNMELARHARIPRSIDARVRAYVDALQRSDLEAWARIDPRHALLAHRAALSVLTALDARDRDRLRVALDALVQALDAIAEGEPVSDDRTGKELVQFLTEVTEAPQSRLAELLGVSLRQFQRWHSPNERAEPEGDDLRKVRGVARIVNQLRFAYTPAGAVEWFWWKLPGRDVAPVDILGDVSRLPELIAEAAASRSMTST
jgi:hypothetical protein